MGTADFTLYADEYVSVTYSQAEGIFRFVRTSVPYPNIEAAQDSYEALLPLLPHALSFHKSPRLLVDMRKAPARNDPQFEDMQRSRRQQLIFGFAKVATLLSSRAGLLHVQRFAREDHATHMKGFKEESEAVRYLREETPDSGA